MTDKPPSADRIRHDFPALCVNPNCRPNRTDNRSNLCHTCADRLRENLTHMANVWPDLADRLASADNHALSERVKTSRTPGLNVNDHVSETMRAVTSWVWFLARVIDSEKQPTVGPKDGTTDEALRWVAWHSEHFANHVDSGLAGDVAAEAWDHRKAVTKAAYPSGAKRVDVPLQCTEHATTDLGERVPCDGTMFAIVHPQAAYEPDLICTTDATHRVAPADWRRVGWARKAHPVGIQNFLKAVAG